MDKYLDLSAKVIVKSDGKMGETAEKQEKENKK
jgi:hypothetical protein